MPDKTCPRPAADDGPEKYLAAADAGGVAFGECLEALLAAGADVAAALPHFRRLWFTPWRVDPGPGVRAREAGWTSGAAPVEIALGARMLRGYETGSGPTVLLVHGWGDYAARMGALARAVAAGGMRVLALDLPGHGASEGRGTDLYEIADVVAELASREDARAVVAHSLGGQGVCMALPRLPSVQAVALLAPAVTLDASVETFARLFALPAGSVEALRATIESKYDPLVWQSCDVPSQIADARAEALILHSRDDDQIAAADVARLAAAWPGAVLEQLDGLGHTRILRDPGVAGRVVQFLQERLAPEPGRAPDAARGLVPAGRAAGPRA